MSIVGTNVLGGVSSSSFASDSALKVPAGGVYQTMGLVGLPNSYFQLLG